MKNFLSCIGLCLLHVFKTVHNGLKPWALWQQINIISMEFTLTLSCPPMQLLKYLKTSCTCIVHNPVECPIHLWHNWPIMKTQEVVKNCFKWIGSCEQINQGRQNSCKSGGTLSALQRQVTVGVILGGSGACPTAKF
jgi:hypothetical protein